MEKRINQRGKELDTFVSVAEFVVVLALIFGAVFFFVFALSQRRENRRLQAAVDAQEELLDRQHQELKELEAFKQDIHRPVLVGLHGAEKGKYAYVTWAPEGDCKFMPYTWVLSGGVLMTEFEAKKAGFKPSGETLTYPLLTRNIGGVLEEMRSGVRRNSGPDDSA